MVVVIFDWIRFNSTFVFVLLFRLVFRHSVSPTISLFPFRRYFTLFGSITRFSIPSIRSVTSFPYSVSEGHVSTGIS